MSGRERGNSETGCAKCWWLYNKGGQEGASRGGHGLRSPASLVVSICNLKFGNFAELRRNPAILSDGCIHWIDWRSPSSNERHRLDCCPSRRTPSWSFSWSLLPPVMAFLVSSTHALDASLQFSPLTLRHNQRSLTLLSQAGGLLTITQHQEHDPKFQQRKGVWQVPVHSVSLSLTGTLSSSGHEVVLVSLSDSLMAFSSLYDISSSMKTS